ncbi:hypothetical protein [Flavobacterium sp.]
MEKFKKYAYYFILILPVIVFYGLFFKHTVNAPINDDYQAILDSLNKILNTESLSEKIKILFSQHNEHRIVYDRIWTIISYKLQYNVDFNFLSLIGNLSLLGMAIIFYRRFTALQKPTLLFLTVTVFLFNMTSWENVTFAMATLSNFTVFLFVLISLGFITSDTLGKKRNLYLAFLFLFLAAITQGGGLFLIPISLLVLIYKKEYKNAVIYGVLCLGLIALYFYGYQKPPQSMGIVESVVKFKFDIVLFALAFLGNAFNYYMVYNNPEYSCNFTMLVGALFLLLFIYITYTKYYKKNLFIYSLMLLLVMSAFVTAVSRTSFGVLTAGSSRYRINGILFFITLFFWFIETRDVKKKPYFYSILAFTIAYFFFINLRQAQYLSIREKQTYTGILNYNYGNHEMLNGEKSMVGLYKSILEESKNMDTYNLPDNKQLEAYFPFSENTIIREESGDASAAISNNTENIAKFPDAYVIDGWAYLDGYNTSSQIVYVGIKNTEDVKPIFYIATKYKRYDLGPYFRKSNLDDGGYNIRIRESLIKSGENEIWVMVINDDQTKIIKSDKKIIK